MAVVPYPFDQGFVAGIAVADGDQAGIAPGRYDPWFHTIITWHRRCYRETDFNVHLAFHVDDVKA